MRGAYAPPRWCLQPESLLQMRCYSPMEQYLAVLGETMRSKPLSEEQDSDYCICEVCIDKLIREGKL